MKVVGVIPARFASVRFPGKPLKKILGKPLLQWVVEGVRDSKSLHKIKVATDHPEILQLAESLGVEGCMTSSELPSGTDRVHAATLNEDADVVINIQGDEPLMTGSVVDQLAAPFQSDLDLPMATLGRSLKPGDLESPNTAKVVLNAKDEALYFSRFAIPFSRVDVWSLPGACVKHIGLYAYRPEFLRRFCAQGAVDIEKAEGLEQLRALYLGARIKLVRVEHDSWGVDTPEDVARVEEILRSRK
ncbi:MAG: 3-deoxy-manno-octulosonate cytidylyltransferase [Bdellovibrionales bacterium]|nr:3-deoxy-manno-octulosonate cytidylyltransferase [Bdellovibrionales bacterium]